MKELSIEEKVVAYDNAIERAKNYYNTTDSVADSELIELIFPELKESEDERIRNGLIGYFRAGKCENISSYHGISTNDILAWLEKQGEQPRKVSIWKHWKDGIAGNGEGKLIYLIKNGDDYSLSSCLGFECDYIELSELDKLMQEEKQGEQKCNEEYNIAGIKSKNAEGKLGEMIMNLKSVNEVLEQKLAEWSEEDKKMFVNIKACLRNANKDYSAELDWLKFLKPQKQWKPSEEQINALKWILMNVPYCKHKEEIDGLLEQLKQL